MIEDALIITFLKPDYGDIPVLLVGRKGVNELEILNCFTGKDAINLHKKLVTMSKKNECITNSAKELRCNCDDQNN